MSEVVGNLPRKFSNFRHLGGESSAHNLPEDRESEIPQNVAESKAANTIETGKTANSPAEGLSSLEEAPVRAKSIGAELGYENRDLTMAEKHCVLTSSDDDVEDFIAFVTERLQCLNEGSVEKLVGEERVNVEEILCGSVGIGEDGGGNGQPVCLNMSPGGDIGSDVERCSPGEETDRILQKEFGSANITSTPKKISWPIYTKKRGSVLGEQEGPLCKAVIFDVASGSGIVEGVEVSRKNVTDRSEGVPESFVTSGGFSTLEGIARHQVEERFVGVRVDDEGEGMVRVPPVDEMFGQEAAAQKRTRFYPSQSAKSLLKDCFEMNTPTH